MNVNQVISWSKEAIVILLNESFRDQLVKLVFWSPRNHVRQALITLVKKLPVKHAKKAALNVIIMENAIKSVRVVKIVLEHQTLA
jgi:hypothetical protein